MQCLKCGEDMFLEEDEDGAPLPGDRMVCGGCILPEADCRCMVGVDPLARVFDDTAGAPMPLAECDAGGNLEKLHPAEDDPRWDVDVARTPLGAILDAKIRPKDPSG